MCMSNARTNRAAKFGGRGFFPVNSGVKVALCKSMCISVALARTKSALRGCPDLGAWHFSCKFSHEIALVKCPCAFQLHAQIVRLSSGGAPFSCQFSRKSGFVRCPCAFRLCRLAQSVRLSSPCAYFVWHAQDQDLAEVLVRRCCEDLADFFCCPFLRVTSSCVSFSWGDHRTLLLRMFIGKSCMKIF